MASTLRARAVPIARVAALMVGGLVLLVLYVLAIWHAPEFLVNRDVLSRANPEHRLHVEHSARLIVVSIGGALVVATGLLYTARNYRLAHRGQVTDRFTKALERLGSNEMYVRIGGLHALEHVMRDSPEHHGDVVEVLVAFIRDRAPRHAEEDLVEDRWMHPPIGTDPPELPREPAADVQAALTALGQRPERPRRERSRVDLSGLHLQRAKLPGARLEGADLDDAQLQGANLVGARLQDVGMSGTQLNYANLTGAQLKDANLIHAQLRHANLIHAQLQDANLEGAQLQDAVMLGAQLKNANLMGAQLRNALVDGAQLKGANLRGATLTQDQLDLTLVDAYTALPEGLTRGLTG